MPQLYIEKCNSMDRGDIEICRALNLDRYESIEVLLRIYRLEKNFLMDQEAFKKLSRQILEILMDRVSANFYQERKSKGFDR